MATTKHLLTQEGKHNCQYMGEKGDDGTNVDVTMDTGLPESLTNL